MADDNFVTAEQHHATRAHKPVNNRRNVTKTVSTILIGLALAGLSFYAGVQYQNEHQQTATTNSGSLGTVPASGNLGRTRFGGRRTTLGKVTSISSSSITVDTRSGTSKTFAINSNTAITNNGQVATTSVINPGDSVAVIPSSTDSSQALRILVNPGFGGNTPPASGSAPIVTN